MSKPVDNPLGNYLKDRRTKLDPAALGFPMTRRRTPGLRREEVAQRANVSATWYTWLEQGRGGLPSEDVLDRISRALMLTDVEREHLFLIALNRPPAPRYRAVEGITPRLQHILDVLEYSPALIRTATWDVVAWNRAAAVMFGDYTRLAPSERNILRLMFSHSRVRSSQHDWESVARSIVATFRAETARAGAMENVKALVEELCRLNPEFEKIWKENEVLPHGGGTKKFRHPDLGLVSLEYSTFSVDGRPDLTLVIYNPETSKDLDNIRKLLKGLG